ncbi:hypothetical protein GCM10009426_05180 [Rheinheimera tangshanensis]|nr:hypothetical protein GCM10010920_05020 [Rheinheimera tangshanensis]
MLFVLLTKIKPTFFDSFLSDPQLVITAYLMFKLAVKFGLSRINFTSGTKPILSGD